MNSSRKPLRSSLLIASFMLISRIAGLIRDMVTAAVIGMSSSPAADAFFLAFRVPNLGRRLIEEGALGLSWIPAFSSLWNRDRASAWDLLARFLRRGAKYVLVVVLALELAATAGILLMRNGDSETLAPMLQTLVILRLMLPYFFFALLTAQCAATLQATGRFGVAAAVPILFNLVWLVALWFIAPTSLFPFPALSARGIGLNPDILTPYHQTAILSCAIVLASGLQFAVERVYLSSLKKRLPPLPDEKSIPTIPLSTKDGGEVAIKREKEITSVFARIPSTALGLLFIQINTLFATLAASLSVHLPFLHKTAPSGAAAAIYFAERLYEFPLGLIGVAVGTAFYPLLVQRVSSNEISELKGDIVSAVGAVLTFSLPAAAGLFWLSLPLTVLLFKRGNVSAEDVVRTADLIKVFALGVPVFCVQPILIRTFYALGDRKHPIRAGVISTLFFFACLVLFCLIQSCQEIPLIIAVVLAAILQTGILAWSLHSVHSMDCFLTRAFCLPFLRALGVTFVTFFSLHWGFLALEKVFASTDTGRFLSPAQLILCAVPAAMVLYFGLLALAGEREIFLFLLRKRKK